VENRREPRISLNRADFPKPQPNSFRPMGSSPLGRKMGSRTGVRFRDDGIPQLVSRHTAPERQCKSKVNKFKHLHVAREMAHGLALLG
jgi:hypothetical protein